MIRPGQQNGFILMPVVLAIALIATLAFLLNNQSAISVTETGDMLEAEQAEQLAQAALAHAVWGAQNSGCTGDMSMTSVPFGQGSYTATVDAAATSISQYSFNPDHDAAILENSPAAIGGSDTELKVKEKTSFGSTRSLLHYDLSTIPAGARVTSATAWFYVTLNNNVSPVYIHPVTEAWTEATASWDSISTRYSSQVFGVLPQQSATGVWLSVNLAALVQSWVNDASTNYGIMLIGFADDLQTQFTSSEYSTTNLRPYLQVTTAVGDVSSLNITVTGTLTGNPSPTNDITRTLNRTAVTSYQPDSYSVLQLQPGSGKDATLSDFYSSRNYGDYSLRVTTASASSARNSLVQFDVGAIPVGARVISAQLQLYHSVNETAGIDPVVSVYRLNRDWVEGTQSGSGTADGATWDSWDGTTNWTSTGGDYDPTPVASSLVTDAINDWESWEIMSLVQGWLDGSFTNNGLLLKGSGKVGASFASKEDVDTTLHPKLIITYACECGSTCLAPQGSGNVLMVVGDDSVLTAADAKKKALFESWGYTVNLQNDNTSAGGLLSQADSNDVVYVSESVVANTLGSKLTELTIGVVSEQGELNDELGIAADSAWTVGLDINVSDNSHYITALFPSGALDIYSASMEQLMVSGATAPDLQQLADSGGAGSLVLLETGAAENEDGSYSGDGTASGRRVMLPIGRDGNFNWDYLNNNGRLIVQRALQWGTGNTGGAPVLIYRDEFTNRNCNAADYTGSDGALDWSPWAWVESADDGSSCGGSIEILEDPVVIDPGNYRLELTNANNIIQRTVDISAFTTAWLSFDFRRENLANSDELLVEFWDDAGGAWVELDRIVGPATDASYQSTSYDISAYISANAALSYKTIGLGNINLVYVDNIQISETAPPLTEPIAHWKLDETSGVIAVDSVGGHDGTLNKPQVWSAGQLDGALNFDGTNDAIRVPHADTLSLTDTMTFIAWVNASSYGGSYQTIVAKDASGTGSNYYFGTWQQELVFGFFSGGFFREVFTSGLNLQTATWYQLAATFDNATDEVVLYVDGAQVHSGTLAYSPTAVTADLSIGRSPDGEYWPGLLDDVRLYDSVLPASEIADLYTVGGGGGGGIPPPASVVYEEFTEAALGVDGSSLNISKPAGTVAGDLLVAAVATDGNNTSSLVPPAGWNVIHVADSGGKVTFGVWWKIAAASESSSYTFSWTSNEQAYGWIMRFTGFDPASPVNVASNDAAASSTPPSPSVVTTVANALILRLGGFDEERITAGLPGLSGHTAINMGSSNGGKSSASGGSGYVEQALAGDSGASNFDLSRSQEYVTVTIAITPAP